MIAALRFSEPEVDIPTRNFAVSCCKFPQSRRYPRRGYQRVRGLRPTHGQPQWPPHENHSLSHAQERGVLLNLLLIAIPMLFAPGTALYFAYVETEPDLPIRQKPHHGVRA